MLYLVQVFLPARTARNLLVICPVGLFRKKGCFFTLFKGAMPLVGEQQWDVGVISQRFGATGKERCVPTQ